MNNRIIMVFEPLSCGHRVEFLRHIIRGVASKEGNNCFYVFVVAPVVKERLGIVKKSCDVIALSDEEVERLQASQGFLSGFVHWRILNRYLDQFKPDHLLILELTKLELPLCFFRPRCLFSAILFVQYPELQRSAKFFFKHLKTTLLLRNKRLHRLFLLNGGHACDFLNSHFSGQKFIPIPDPLDPVVVAADYNVRDLFGIDTGKKLFLFFGSISKRKGALELLDALAQVNPATAKKISVLICGLPEAPFRTVFESELQKLSALRKELHLVYKPEHISDCQMAAMFEQVDWVLMPYNRPEYSSGILVHSAVAKTPVIGPGSGLLGRLIRENRLGITTLVSGNDLAHSIKQAVVSDFEFDNELRDSFVRNSDPHQFAEIILDQIGAMK